jgi:hypothetical protein
MNRKQLITLLVTGVLIGGLGLFLYNRRAASWSAGNADIGRKIIADLPVNDISHIVIRQPGAELNLVRDQIWTVQERWNYPANFREISNFLLKANDLKAVQTMQVGPAHLGRLELLDPSQEKNAGTLVEFRDSSGQPLKALLLGKTQMREERAPGGFGGAGGFPVGRYVMLHGASGQVGLVSEPFSQVEANPERWLDKDFFKVEKLKSVSVQQENGSSWTLLRDTESGEFRLSEEQEGEELDSSKLWGFRNLFSSPSFVDVVSPEVEPGALGLDQALSARIETFDGLIYNVQIGKKQANDNYPLRLQVELQLPEPPLFEGEESPEEKAAREEEFQARITALQEKIESERRFQNWTYLVSNWTVDPLLKERGELLRDQTDEQPAAEFEFDEDDFGKPFEINPFGALEALEEND